MKVYINNSIFDLWDNNSLGAGAADVTDPIIERCVITNCRTHFGKTSETLTDRSYTAVAGTAVTFSNHPTNPGVVTMAALSTGVAFSFAIATPGVITATAHGLAVGDTILTATLSTTTGGLALATYYTILPTGFTANSFQVRLFSGGSSVAFTAAGTGTFTAYAGMPVGACAAFYNTNINNLPDPIKQTAFEPIFWVATTPAPTATTFSITKIKDGAAVPITNAGGAGPHLMCKRDTQVITGAINFYTYLTIPETHTKLMWRPITQRFTPQSAAARAKMGDVLAPYYPATTGAVGDLTRARLRTAMLVASPVVDGDVLTFAINAAIAPPRDLSVRPSDPAWTTLIPV
jgi:hypothetical protein